LNIVYVITRSDVIGGASVHLMDLASGVRRSGHEITVLVGGKGMLLDKLREKGLPYVSVDNLVREIDPYHDLLCFFELKKKIRALNPDLIHLHSSKAGIIGRLVGRSLGVPCIFTAHGWSFTDGVPNNRRLFYKFIEASVASITNAIITVSDYDRSIALKNGVGDPDKIKSIHNGMPDLSIEECRGKSTSYVRLIMVARFDEPKNQSLLIESLSLLKNLPWELELVGDGPKIKNVKNEAKALGISDRVIFSGACDDVPDRLARADIFLLVSNWEGFPLTILEAMRAGIPVIASDVGGVREAVENKKNGYLIKDNDVKPLSIAISSLVESSDLRRDMGREGRKRYEKEFTFDVMLENTMNLYRNVIEG